MVDFIPIGSFSILTNVEARQNDYPDDILLLAVSEAITLEFKNKLKQYPNLESVFITNVRTERGCIISTITLGAIATTLGGLYVFLKDYDKLKANLKLIIADFKNVYLIIRHKKKGPKDPPEIEIYKQLPDDMKKYYSAGNNTVIYSSVEQTTEITKIAVMRDDLVEHFEEKTIKERVVTIISDTKTD